MVTNVLTSSDRSSRIEERLEAENRPSQQLTPSEPIKEKRAENVKIHFM